jgi:hypothetical protein
MSGYCNLCGRPLGRGARHYRHPAFSDRPLQVCGYCERLAPRCRQCHQPMRIDRAVAGLCAACAAGAPRCLACGSLLADRYYEINGRGPFCETCHATRKRCDVCGVPLDAQVQWLPDGRAICGTCQLTAIMDAERAHQLFEWVVDVVGSVLGLQLRIGVRFTLSDRVGVRAQLQKIKPEHWHDADKVLGVYVRDGRHRTIYVQNGLPQILFVQVVAHEWTHAWQAENCPLVRDVLIVEGFAEWVAYKVLQAMQASKKMALMTERPDLYGVGLRVMLAREGRAGESGVLALACERTLAAEFGAALEQGQR